LGEDISFSEGDDGLIGEVSIAGGEEQTSLRELPWDKHAKMGLNQWKLVYARAGKVSGVGALVVYTIPIVLSFIHTR